MDWRTLYLSADGRIGQKDFWIAVLILFVAWVVSTVLMHIFSPIAWLLLLYPWICVFSKRLHDFGKSGWMILIPFIVGCVAGLMALVFGGVAAISAIFGAAQGEMGSGSWALLAGALGTAVAFLAVAGLVKLIFILWVGLSRGDPGANRYGPPPASLTSPTTPTPASPA